MDVMHLSRKKTIIIKDIPNDGVLNFAVQYTKSIYSIHTLSHYMIPDLDVPLDGKQLCNDNDEKIFIKLEDAMVSPMFEIVLDRASNSPFEFYMALPLQNTKEMRTMEAEDFCFSRIVVDYGGDIPTTVTCIKRLQENSLYESYYVYISLEDIQYGTCANKYCTQNSDINVYYAALAIGRNETNIGGPMYKPVTTFFQYKLYRWGCRKKWDFEKKDTIDTYSDMNCVNGEYSAEMYKSRNFYRIFESDYPDA